MKGVIFVNEFFRRGDPLLPVGLERLCGVSLLDRHLRTLDKCGIQSVTVIFPDRLEPGSALTGVRARVKADVRVVPESRANDALHGSEDDEFLALAGDYLIDQRFIDFLISAGKPSLLVHGRSSTTGTGVPIGCMRIPGKILQSRFQRRTFDWASIAESMVGDRLVEVMDAESISTYHHSVQRHRQNIWIRITDSATLRKAKEWVIAGAQKGSLDLPAQKLHAPIENYLISRLCETSITPNQLTLITNILAWSVTWAILSGYIWPALVGAALVGIVDGLDGKLARVKMMTSKFGEFEHLFDMLFEYSWWLSLGWVLGGADPDSTAFMLGVTLVALNFSDTWIAIIFWFVLGSEHGRTIDNYTPFDHFVRKISGRRNIYIWLLLLTGPIVGLYPALWLCVCWGIATVVVRGGRMLWLKGTGRPPMDFAF